MAIGMIMKTACVKPAHVVSRAFSSVRRFARLRAFRFALALTVVWCQITDVTFNHQHYPA